MSDPLSVAGSVVGIVSLGIQLCQGAISFARSIKGREKEIAEAIGELKALNSILASLNSIVPAVGQAKIDSADIRQCLTSTQTTLRDFELYLAKLKGTQRNDSLRIPAKVLRSVKYPFQEDGILSLRQSVQRLLDTLTLALNAASLQSTLTQNDKIVAIDATVKSIKSKAQAHEKDTTTLRDQIRNNGEKLLEIESAITDALNDIKQSFALTQTVVRDMEQNISTRLTIVDNSITSTRQMTEEKLEEVMERLSAVSVLVRTVLQQEESQDSHLEYETSVRPERRFRRQDLTRSTMATTAATCTCKNRTPIQTSVRYRYWNFSLAFDQQRFPEHERGCLLYKINQKATSKIQVQIPFKMAWLSHRIILACVDFVLGTSKPGVSVTLKNIVPRKYDPFYKKMRLLWGGLSTKTRSPKAFLEQFHSFEREVLSLYRDGKSSPHYQNERGHNHATAFVNDFLSSFWVKLPESVIDSALQLSRVLADTSQSTLETMYVNFICLTAYGVHNEALRLRADDNLDIRKIELSSLQPQIYSVRVALIIGVEFEPNMRHINSIPRVHPFVIHNFRLAEIIPDLLDDPNLTPLTRAIFAHSTEDLENCIAKYPETLTERVGDFSPVQLCVGWPLGLERLLQTPAGRVAREDWQLDNPDSPLSLAIAYQYNDSIDLLTRTGSPLGTRPWEEASFWDVHMKWSLVSMSTPRLASELVASRIASRRRELLSTVQKRLGIFTNCDESDVADGDAAFLFKALFEAGTLDISHLYVDATYETIFHTKGLPTEFYRMFYEHGLRSHRRYDRLGRTPIMTWHDFGSTHLDNWLPWLNEHGFLDQTPEAIQQDQINSSATGWHYAAAFLGKNRGHLLGQLENLKALWRAREKDECICWCNPPGDGCSPFQSFWKSIILHSEGRCYRHDMGLICDWSRNEAGDCDLALGIRTRLVRFTTFAALGMRHTCCSLAKHATWTWAILKCKPGKAQEIRADEEELQNADLLDTLMEEFTRELRKSPPNVECLRQFFMGYWRRRMSELFAVDPDVLANLEATLSKVQTHAVSEGVKVFLGKDFEWEIKQWQ